MTTPTQTIVVRPSGFQSPITFLTLDDGRVQFAVEKADGYAQALSPVDEAKAQKVIELIQYMDNARLSAGVIPMLLRMFAPVKPEHAGRHYCSDCGINTSSRIGGHWEYYMVTDEVWEHATWFTQNDGKEVTMLCIGCLEDRLSRYLKPTDFTFCPANTNPFRPRSARLRSRMGYMNNRDD